MTDVLPETVVPLVSERLTVGKHVVETGQVHVRVHVLERAEQVREDLAQEDVEVRRVPIGHVVEAPPEVRHEGDLTIVPIVEEVLVKQLVLKEELHIRRTRRVTPFEQTVTLRSEEAEVERTPAERSPVEHPKSTQTRGDHV